MIRINLLPIEKFLYIGRRLGQARCNKRLAALSQTEGYGAGFDDVATRKYTDTRYSGRCAHPKCTRKVLMPFMRYCPWCRTKVKRDWQLKGNRHRCPSCRWGVLPSYWNACPWCGKQLAKKR